MTAIPGPPPSVRAGRELEVAVSLEIAPETPRDEVVIRSRSPFLGARIANLSPALADELRIDPSTDGVVIIDVARGSISQSIGFRPGDVVIAVNNVEIRRTRDLERLARESRRTWRVTLMRGGQKMTVAFGG